MESHLGGQFQRKHSHQFESDMTCVLLKLEVHLCNFLTMDIGGSGTSTPLSGSTLAGRLGMIKRNIVITAFV